MFDRTRRLRDKEKNKGAAETSAAEKATVEKELAEKVAAEKPAAEKGLAEKTAAAVEKGPAAEKAASDEAAAEKAASEKAAAEKAASEKAAAEKAAAEATAAEKAASEKAAAEKAAAAATAAAQQKTAQEMECLRAELAKLRAVAENERAVVEEAVAAKAAAEAAAAEQAAEKAAAEKAEAEKSAAESAAVEAAATKAAVDAVAEVAPSRADLERRLNRARADKDASVAAKEYSVAQKLDGVIERLEEQLAAAPLARTRELVKAELAAAGVGRAAALAEKPPNYVRAQALDATVATLEDELAAQPELEDELATLVAQLQPRARELVEAELASLRRDRAAAIMGKPPNYDRATALDVTIAALEDELAAVPVPGRARELVEVELAAAGRDRAAALAEKPADYDLAAALDATMVVLQNELAALPEPGRARELVEAELAAARRDRDEVLAENQPNYAAAIVLDSTVATLQGELAALPKARTQWEVAAELAAAKGARGAALGRADYDSARKPGAEPRERAACFPGEPGPAQRRAGAARSRSLGEVAALCFPPRPRPAHRY